MNTLMNINRCTDELIEDKAGDFLRFLQYNLKNPEARVVIIDELGVTAEMSLHNIEIELSPYEPIELTLNCSGPVKMNYPKGVEAYNGTNWKTKGRT